MKSTILPAVLLFAPALALAGDLVPPMTIPDTTLAAQPVAGPDEKALPQAVAALQASVEAAEECFGREAELASDLARKKAALSSEFKGKIPPAFNDLLWQKTTRVNRQHSECVQQYVAIGKQFDQLAGSFEQLDLKRPDVKRMKGIHDAQKARFLRLMPGSRPAPRAAKPKPSAE